jgi:RNA polymerase-binding transcription factor DksA
VATTVADVTDAPHDAVADEPGADSTATAPTAPHHDVDLDAVERDLAAVEVALGRLADGTYWTDEVTGEPIAEDVLARNPLARRS